MLPTEAGASNSLLNSVTPESQMTGGNKREQTMNKRRRKKKRKSNSLQPQQVREAPQARQRQRDRDRYPIVTPGTSKFETIEQSILLRILHYLVIPVDPDLPCSAIPGETPRVSSQARVYGKRAMLSNLNADAPDLLPLSTLIRTSKTIYNRIWVDQDENCWKRQLWLCGFGRPNGVQESYKQLIRKYWRARAGPVTNRLYWAAEKLNLDLSDAESFDDGVSGTKDAADLLGKPQREIVIHDMADFSEVLPPRFSTYTSIQTEGSATMERERCPACSYIR